MGRTPKKRKRKRNREHQTGVANPGLDGNHESPRRNELKTAD
jgi:hypothetical protein